MLFKEANSIFDRVLDVSKEFKTRFEYHWERRG